MSSFRFNVSLRLVCAVLVVLLPTGADAHRVIDVSDWGKPVSPQPGTPCADACDRDPGASECALCCRGVRHEVDWACNGATPVGCCSGEWDASCWDVPSEKNHGHACDMCRRPQERGPNNIINCEMEGDVLSITSQEDLDAIQEKVWESCGEGNPWTLDGDLEILGVGVGDLSALKDLTRINGGRVAVACTGTDACRGKTLDASEVQWDLVLTCSGERACRDMIVLCPPSPHACDVRCAGSGSGTCDSIDVKAEGAARLAFACGTSNGGCGYSAKLACPVAAVPPPAGAPVCAVRCKATGDAAGTCRYMTVEAGPAGARIACSEAGTPGQSTRTCYDLKLIPPTGDGEAENASLRIDCES